jgi:hypothetical protein
MIFFFKKGFPEIGDYYFEEYMDMNIILDMIHVRFFFLERHGLIDQ